MLNIERKDRAAENLDLRIRGEIVGPADPGYDRARQAWNLSADQRPAFVAFPESAEDVVAIVQYAGRQGLRIAPQGTGHNAVPIVWDETTVLLSTVRMRGVIIDVPGRRARVAAGTLWLEVTAPASEHGLAPLAGSSPDVGVVGYSLGGGISWLARKHGLSANSVLAIELVTADGRLRRVDAEHDADLFWALRGGGGSFGVVTAMEIALYPMPELYAGAMFWPWERSAEVMHAWREWTETAPEEVTSSARIMQLPPIPEIPEPLRGRAWVTIDAAVIGSRAFGAGVVQALRALEPEIDTFDMVAPVALSRLHNDPEDPMPGMAEHRLLGSLPAEAIDAFVAAAGPGSGSPLLLAEIRHLGGALGVATPGHGATAKLDAAYLLFGAGISATPELVAALEVGLPAFKAAMAPWDAGRGYLNFEENTVDSRLFYDEVTHRRLSRIKAQVDPRDMFRSNHPIAPARG
jgi:FAD binding domain-containing protein/berberine-like enzyme